MADVSWIHELHNKLAYNPIILIFQTCQKIVRRYIDEIINKLDFNFN